MNKTWLFGILLVLFISSTAYAATQKPSVIQAMQGNAKAVSADVFFYYIPNLNKEKNRYNNVSNKSVRAYRSSNFLNFRSMQHAIFGYYQRLFALC